jgi:hypothetical protein
MQTVPCELRPMINQMCPHEGSFTMHGNGKLMNTYTVYEVYVYKTQAITYLYGHDWRKFACDYGLKKGDELRIRNSNGQIYVTAYRVGDTSKYIICNFFLLISFDNCILSSCSKPFPLF